MKMLSIFCCGLLATVALAADPTEADYYTITDIPVPEGIVFEVSGIELLPDNKIAACSRRGDVYVIANAFDDDTTNDEWTLFASGLHEPLGLSWYDGWLWCTQRPEVTKMKDVDGDGRADIFECVSDDWGIKGDYHEYAFGTQHDKDGNIWIVLCLTGSGGAASDYRGWCVRVNADGTFLPTTSGIRSPGGIGFNHKGDVFYGDNQGLWNGTSSVKHLKPGSFQGNPTGNIYYPLTDAIGERPVDPVSGSRIIVERQKVKELVPPAINLPHGIVGKSTSGLTHDSSGGKFGPFNEQLLVLDQGFSNIVRCSLEEVNGVYQGAAFHFRKGFGSGNIAARMSSDGDLFIGGTNRGWGSVGRKAGALERVNWTGKVPFEVHAVRITETGFKLTFTEPVDPATVQDLSGYALQAYTYIYQKGYGSPQVDKVEPMLESVSVSADGLSATLTLDKIYKGHTYQMQFTNIRSAKGLPLLHNEAFYTVNEVLGEEIIFGAEAKPEAKPAAEPAGKPEAKE